MDFRHADNPIPFTDMNRARGHTGEPGCDCGKCEPAVLDGPLTAGQMLSDNPGCEWPSCAMGERCMWGDTPCFDTRSCTTKEET